MRPELVRNKIISLAANFYVSWMESQTKNHVKCLGLKDSAADPVAFFTPFGGNTQVGIEAWK